MLIYVSCGGRPAAGALVNFNNLMVFESALMFWWRSEKL
jgi:hypothetical protein